MKRASCLVALSALLGVSEILAQSIPPATTQAVATATATAVNAAIAATGTTGGPFVPPGVTPVTVLQPGPASQARLINLSTRARVTADGPLITGFAISGTVARTVLVRAAGPGLAAFGVSGALAAPRLQLRDASGTLVLENAGWSGSTTLANTFARAGAFPFVPGSADSAIIATLSPGTYTVQVLDASGGVGGVALAEIYDVGNPADDSRLANVSTRSTVAAGGGELISGFVLDGNAPRQFLLRGVGPGLSKFGVSGTLGNPGLAVFDRTGGRIAVNDDWSGTPGVAAVTAIAVATPVGGTTSVPTATNLDLLRTASRAAGAFDLDLNSYDAALVTTLNPGAYTVQVTGGSTVIVTGGPATGLVNGATTQLQSATLTLTVVPPAPGVALLEIYELP